MGALRCVGVTKLLGGTRVLDSFDLEFPVDGLVAIIGPNGAGKTTLLNILTGFLRADRGQCFVRDVETTRFPPFRIARLGVSRTFQELRLVRRVSVRENLELALSSQSNETMWHALGRSKASEEETLIAQRARQLLSVFGLDRYAESTAGQLSYGEQKLLAIACCAATESRVLLLDEPIAGLHPEMASRVLEKLAELRSEGRLVVFVEHDIEAVRRAAELVVVMDSGRIVAKGCPTEVLERSDVAEAYLG